MTLEIRAVTGIGDIRPGDDLAALIVAAAPWLADGDVLVITSKVVSKVEGRLVEVPTDGPEREAARDALLEKETARPVARRGSTRIVATHHGFVLASAGIDASNVDRSRLVLLPVDPDASARRLRTELRELFITQMAVIDELAAAGELVKGKHDQVPVAVVRGFDRLSTGDGEGARVLVRDVAADLFSLGTAEARALGMHEAAMLADVVAFAAGPVDLVLMDQAIAAAGLRAARVTDATVREKLRTAVPAIPELAAELVVPWTAGTAPLAVARAGAAMHRCRAALAAEGIGTAWLDAEPATLAGIVALEPGATALGVLAVGQIRS